MDQLERGLNGSKTIRVVTAVTTELVREACQRHGLSGAEAVVLGRALTAGCLMATLTKSEQERVRIDMRGGGPVGGILVDSRAGGEVRGCLQRRPEQPGSPEWDRGRIRIGEWVGKNGVLVVTRDLGLEEQYQGSVPIVSGEVDDDLEHYLNQSEQLPSSLSCEVVLDPRGQVLRAAGILCQTFPGAAPEALRDISSNLHGENFAELLHHDRSTEELMGFALLGSEFESMGRTPLCFRCNCGPERALSVVATLGAEEVQALAREPGDTEVRCAFCGAKYAIMAEQLFGLAEQLRQTRS